MRPSSRSIVLDATAAIARRAGITAVTFEAVAAESGLSRGGIIYHFPSKLDLLRAMYEHLAEAWEEHLLHALGKPFAEATPAERTVAYVRAALSPSTQADIALLGEATVDFDGPTPSQQLIARWSPASATALADGATFALFVARLLADGVWLDTSLGLTEMTPALRQAITGFAAALGAVGATGGTDAAAVAEFLDGLAG